jgi:hypothetical protein
MGLFRAYGVQPSIEDEGPPPAPPTDVLTGLQVLILCSGNKKQWEIETGGVCRQFRPWKRGNPESILHRQIRQIREMADVDPIIITHREDIRLHTPDLIHFCPEKRRTIARTWLSTTELWKEQTLVLLGDCVFGSLTMKKMLDHRGSMWMIGNDAEIYAFSFCKAEHQRVIDMLYEVNVETLKAAPWEIYKCWMNYPKPYRQGQGPQEVGRTTQGATNRDDNYVFQWNWDRCCDVDSPAEYAGVLTVDWS